MNSSITLGIITNHSPGRFLALHSIDDENVFESEEEGLKEAEGGDQTEIHFNLEELAIECA